MTTTKQKKPDELHHPVLRVALWFVAPLDDRLHGLSLTRLLAVACFVFVYVDTRGPFRLSWIDHTTLLLGMAAAFGRSMVLALINRTQVQVDGKQDVIDQTIRTITERRGTDYEQTP